MEVGETGHSIGASRFEPSGRRRASRSGSLGWRESEILHAELGLLERWIGLVLQRLHSAKLELQLGRLSPARSVSAPPLTPTPTQTPTLASTSTQSREARLAAVWPQEAEQIKRAHQSKRQGRSGGASGCRAPLTCFASGCPVVIGASEADGVH